MANTKSLFGLIRKAVLEDPAVQRVIDRINREGGEVSIAFGIQIHSKNAEQLQSGEPALNPGELTAKDQKFLRSLRIQID